MWHDANHESGRGGQPLNRLIFYCKLLPAGRPTPSSFDCRRCLRDSGWIGQLGAVLESVHAAVQCSLTVWHDAKHESGRGGQPLNRLISYGKLLAEGGAKTEFV